MSGPKSPPDIGEEKARSTSQKDRLTTTERGTGAEQKETSSINTPAPRISSNEIPPNISAFSRIEDQKVSFYFTARESDFSVSSDSQVLGTTGKEIAKVSSKFYKALCMEGSGILNKNNLCLNFANRCFSIKPNGCKDINIPKESDFPTGSARPVMSTSGKVIARVSSKFFMVLCKTGSGILKDGSCVKFEGYRFNILPSGCKGITARRYWMVPFHTLAVNEKEIPYEGVYYIPKTRNLKLPNGEAHDGYWFAHDTGGHFESSNNRIDMYCDKKVWVRWMESNVAETLSPLEMYRVDEATKQKVYAKYHQLLGR
ncbi:MAG: hypothetical protein PHW04_09720 [Candidatus Wallbacteria bacterium]|nr:hypothetical protein [Candidatus Wallbacteria bacterium]